MCGRYALSLRPDQIRQRLQADGMQVWEAPDDNIYEAEDGATAAAAAAAAGDPGGENTPSSSQGQPRQSYNFAPGYKGIVYRADVPDWGAGSRARSDDGETKDMGKKHQPSEAGHVHCKLQAMKWGLVPFWTKRSPDYSSMMKTINCRDDSLAANGGMWNTMKARKRCIVIAEGFYEWLKVGPKERVPYYIKRKDGKLLLLAGLWDCVKYESDGEKNYTYTIITTDSSEQLKFLHDRMPVILDPGSQNLQIWLDPERHEWSDELQSILKPWDGKLEVYAVSKEVNKVGNNSPSFVVPVASRENKNNIANFFANASGVKSPGKENSPATGRERPGVKRPADSLWPSSLQDETPRKKEKTMTTATATTTMKTIEKNNNKKHQAARTISATENGHNKSPSKGKAKTPAGTQKITNFFK